MDSQNSGSAPLHEESRMAGPTTRPFAKAFACAAVAFVIGTTAIYAALRPSSDPGRALGYLFATVAVPAVITGFLARRSSTAWLVWRIVITFVVALTLAAALQAVGNRTPSRMTAAEIAAGIRSKMKLPAMIDEVTRVDTVDADGDTIVHNVTIMRNTGSVLDRIVGIMRQELTQRYCGRSDVQMFFDQRYLLRFQYRSLDEARHVPVSLTPEMCGRQRKS
jgi:hypothetical protein